jgi:hypothetical protein
VGPYLKIARIRVIRFVFLLHRYLGIGIGVVVSLWCLSGFVMLYVQFPDLTREEQLAGLDELDLTLCCTTPSDFSDIPIERFRVEMMAGRPVLRMDAFFEQYLIDLGDGEYRVEVGEREARRIADRFAANRKIRGDVELLGLIERDQWTVFGGLSPDRPLFHFAASDDAGTEWYISAIHGETTQMTTRTERFWNWLGSVPHWLYPTIVREHPAVWLQLIIWLSVLGLFLTVVGIYIGLRQYKKRSSGRHSPYRGAKLWHHYAGLMFGVLTLTWLFSGLLSVNPWGAFQSRSFAGEVQQLSGGTMSYYPAAAVLNNLDRSSLPPGTVRLEGAMLRGEPYLLAWNREGKRQRVDSVSLHPDPLADRDFASLAEIVRPGAEISDHGWLFAGDAYYYDHHTERPFPVYRIRYDDGERIYLDAVSGELALGADRNRQWSRWLFLGLHRGDFLELMRGRPIWDLMMWTLLFGVTVGALTGTWMGIRRLIG